MQFGGAIPDGPRLQPVGGNACVERRDAVLVEGACEQRVWSGVMERDVEFHDGVSDARGPIVKQSVEWSDRSFDDGGTGLGGCFRSDFV